MSRSNKNNRKKIRLTENGNEPALRCSSSSSSSNHSDDADAMRNAVIESLMKNVAAASKSKALTASMAGKDTDPKDRTNETYRREVTVDDDRMRTDVKIVRIKTLDSEESKLLLIVDVLDRSPYRIEVNGAAKRHEETGKCIKVDIEALKRGECPKEIRNLCTKVRSRRIYKLPDDLMRKFDRKGFKVFEWHSFNRPDDAIRLLLEDGAASSTPSTDQSSSSECDTRKKMIIGFRKRPASTDDDSEYAPSFKFKRTSDSCDAKILGRGIRKMRMAAEQRNRNRILQRLLNEYNMTGVWDANNQTKINRLVRNHLDLRAKADHRAGRRPESGIACVDPIRETMWSVTSENLTNFDALQRDNLNAVNVLLNEDNVASVGSNGADVSAIDGSSDALDSSNNDDNDSKAKKKNRCALCRKKVGLTGFECRCGGLYCGIHRYSDKHNCTFDYRQLGAQEIRRNNPVVIGEKIQKI